MRNRISGSLPSDGQTGSNPTCLVSPETGKVGSITHLGGNRVNQDLKALRYIDRRYSGHGSGEIGSGETTRIQAHSSVSLLPLCKLGGRLCVASFASSFCSSQFLPSASRNPTQLRSELTSSVRTCW